MNHLDDFLCNVCVEEFYDEDVYEGDLWDEWDDDDYLNVTDGPAWYAVAPAFWDDDGYFDCD